MNVKLIGVTAPTEDNMTAEEMIVYMARVSNPANQKANEAGYKLINYLIKNSHWSPFEMVSIDRKSTRLNSSHMSESRMPSSA